MPYYNTQMGLYERIERLEKLTRKGVGGGSGGGPVVVEATREDVLAAITAGTLSAGAIYKIPGCHKQRNDGAPNLYNDGTNSGITVYLEAISPTQLSTKGWGEFYNPKYSLANVYYNTEGLGQWGLYQGEEGEGPTYTVGMTTIRGGYVWECIQETNTNTSYFEYGMAPGFWTKVPYSNSSVYDLKIDQIEYDIETDFISMRYDAEANNLVIWTRADSEYYGTGFHPILGVPWGLSAYYLDPGGSTGVNSYRCISAVGSIINFRGQYCNNVTIEKYAEVSNNLWGPYMTFSNIKVSNWSWINGNSFMNQVYWDSMSFDGASISDNTFNGGAYYYLDFKPDGRISNSTLTGCYMVYSEFMQFAIVNCNLEYFQIMKSTFYGHNNYGDNGIFYSNFTGNCYIQNTEWNNSKINAFEHTDGFNMQRCKVYNTQFVNSTSPSFLNARAFTSCHFENSSFDFTAASANGTNGELGVFYTSNLKTHGVTVANNSFSSLNNNYYKELVKNSGGTNTLAYYNGSNALTTATF